MPRLPMPSDTEVFSEETRAAVPTMRENGTSPGLCVALLAPHAPLRSSLVP